MPAPQTEPTLRDWASLPVGTRIEIVPNHVCMPFVMLRRAPVLAGDTVSGVWEGFGPGASE